MACHLTKKTQIEQICIDKKSSLHKKVISSQETLAKERVFSMVRFLLSF